MCLVFLNPADHTKATEFLTFYLGGQSNMDGFGKVSELPEQLKKQVDGVYIFHGNPAPDQSTNGGAGKWAILKPGHGTGFTSTNSKISYGARFGPELTFGQHIQMAFPGRKIALIKYSRGGTSIHVDAARDFGCWDPDYKKGNGINQYDHFLRTVIHAHADEDIDGDGTRDQLVPMGIVWMQGESDASVNVEIASGYKDNLKELMLAIQAAFRVDDIPVVLGRISESSRDPDKKVWQYGAILRDQQAQYVQDFQPAALITTTDNYGYSDPYHYDTDGYIDLGQQFAVEMAGLIKSQ